MVLLWLVCLLLMGWRGLCQTPTAAPTFVGFSSGYCRQYGGVNTTNTDAKADCIGCVKMGCAYCQISSDDPSQNYCYAYAVPDDPVYGQCSASNVRDADYSDRYLLLGNDEAEEYCEEPYEIPAVLIVLFIFLYLLIPCLCLAAVVSLVMRVFRGVFKTPVAPDNGPHDERYDRPSYRPTRYTPQQQPHYHVAEAQVIQVQPQGDQAIYVNQNGHGMDGMDMAAQQQDIPIVHAEAVSHR